MRKRTFIPLLLIITAFIACDNSRVYEKNNDLDNKVWLADSIQQFEFDIKDVSKKYNIYCNLRNTISYPFQNIYINYTLLDSSGNEVATDLINNDLFDPKTGKPYGDGLGDIFDHQLLLMENKTFKEKGQYKLSLQQFMRRDTLSDVISVGLRIENASAAN